MNALGLIGLSHKTAPVEVREKVAFTESEVPQALGELCRDFGFQEGLILSTCNRVEILGGLSNGGRPFDRLQQFVRSYHGLRESELDGYVYMLEQGDLIRHLFRVASSLDSMILGESQILGQLKRAYSLACDAGTSGKSINIVLPQAFSVAKRVRTETKIAFSKVSVSSVAAELARKIFGNLEGRTVFLIGAGEMSELAARNLLKSGAEKILVANRTGRRSKSLAEQFRGTAVRFSDIERFLPFSDIVLVSTGAGSFILDHDMVERTIRRRRYNPLFIIDISVPRNVDPRINEIENVFVYDIDDLESVVAAGMEDRQKEAEEAEKIVTEELEYFLSVRETNHLGRIIQSLRSTLEEICLSELKNFPDLDEKERNQLERCLKRTAHRIAHPLIQEIKNPLVHPVERRRKLAVLKQAFNLKDPE